MTTVTKKIEIPNIRWQKFLLGFNLFCFSLLIAQTLTLDSCIALAKKNNLKLLEAGLAIAKARADLTEANASYYPTVGLSSGYRYSSDFTNSKTGSFSTGISAQYPVYKGGAIRASTKIAAIRVKIAEENFRQTEQEVILAVKQAFFKIWQIQEQISLIKNILNRRQENLTLLKLNYNVGRENEPNVKQAEAALKETEYQYQKLMQELSLAKLKLGQLINQPGEEIVIQYDDKKVEFPALDSLIQEALWHRPEIISQKANSEIFKAQVNLAKSNYFPVISISSSYGLQADKFFEPKSNWSAGVSLTLPLIDGFATKAKVNAANIALKQQELNLQDLTNTVGQEVRQAYADWQLAMKNLEVTNKILEAARVAYQLTKLQYEQGRTSYFFLQQKESELTQAENNCVNAQYNRRLAIATLEKVLGRSN
ncbi:MAG: TolC family protein [candidate division WOR-3 bacterium]